MIQSVLQFPNTSFNGIEIYLEISAGDWDDIQNQESIKSPSLHYATDRPLILLILNKLFSVFFLLSFISPAVCISIRGGERVRVPNWSNHSPAKAVSYAKELPSHGKTRGKSLEQGRQEDLFLLIDCDWQADSRRGKYKACPCPQECLLTERFHAPLTKKREQEWERNSIDSIPLKSPCYSVRSPVHQRSTYCSHHSKGSGTDIFNQRFEYHCEQLWGFHTTPSAAGQIPAPQPPSWCQGRLLSHTPPPGARLGSHYIPSLLSGHLLPLHGLMSANQIVREISKTLCRFVLIQYARYTCY